MGDYWKSFTEYLWELVRSVWALTGGFFVTLVLYAIDHLWPEATWTYLPFIAGAVVVGICAPYQAFHRVRMQRDVLENQNPERDVGLYDVVRAIGGRYFVDMGGFEDPILDLRQAALDGHIAVWGKKGAAPEDEAAKGQLKPYSPYLRIPADYWSNHTFYWVKGLKRTWTTYTVESMYDAGDGRGVTYVDLMFNRRQIESPGVRLVPPLWPRLRRRIYEWRVGYPWKID